MAVALGSASGSAHTKSMTDHDSGYEAAVSALGLLTATHHDGTLSGPITMAYLAEVAPDRRDAVRLAAGLTALAKMLIALRAEETGVAPEATLAELGRRIQGFYAGRGES